MILAAITSTVYLYATKNSLENKYQSLLKRKEAEFIERTKFENKSPLSLFDLEGTQWEIEIVPLSDASPGDVIKDKISFKDGRFSSNYFILKGLGGSSYFLAPQGGGLIVWGSMQLGGSKKAIWRGDWKGDAMKGVISFKTSENTSQNFYFFSVRWSSLSEKF